MKKLTFQMIFGGVPLGQLSKQKEKGETGKAETIWDRWFKEQPYRFYQRIDSSITTDHIHQYKEDIELMKKTGHNSFRVSISWARMFPNGGTGKVNPKAISFLSKIIFRNE